MAPPQKSIDLPDLQRRTVQQARTESLVPMKYDAGMDPNMPMFQRIGEKARQELDSAPSWLSSGPIGKYSSSALIPTKHLAGLAGNRRPFPSHSHQARRVLFPTIDGSE